MREALFFMVVVAQLVRAPVCGSGGRGFESHLPPRIKARYFCIGLFCLISFRHAIDRKTHITKTLNSIAGHTLCYFNLNKTSRYYLCFCVENMTLAI